MDMTIGTLANLAGVNVQTIRYYERRGLLPTPRRTRSGYRQYAGDDAARIRFIKRAQELGFSLGEIEELLTLRVEENTACTAVESKTRAKIAVVDEKIGHLHSMRDALVRLARACERNAPTAECPVLETLEGHR